MTDANLRTQKIKDGYGPLFHRVYSVPFACDQEETLRGVMRLLRADINKFSPQLLARFEKIKGDPDLMNVGDEYQIHITGPWNGPVRVAEVDEDHFRLVTLEGHMEAGEIVFRLNRESPGKVLFEIESLARSKDAIVDLVYDKVPIAKLAQTEMWKSVLNSFVERCGRCAGEIEVITERHNEKTGEWEKI